jgi:type II secretory pathway predicted ATPase ExeA
MHACRKHTLLARAHFDSRALLTVVLAGAGRLTERFHADELQPLASRIRVRLPLERGAPPELADVLRHACATAGNARLMTPELVATLAEHAAGNLRILHGLAADLLAAGAQREVKQLDEKLYREIVAPPTDKPRGPTPSARPARPR